MLSGVRGSGGEIGRGRARGALINLRPGKVVKSVSAECYSAVSYAFNIDSG